MAKNRTKENQSFFEQVAGTSLNIPVAVQNELAGMVQRAYSSTTLANPKQAGELFLDLSAYQQYLPPGTHSLNGLEMALQRSITPQLLSMTQRIVENRGPSADASAIFDDLYMGALGSARNYQETFAIKSGEKIPVTFAHYASRQAFQAAAAERRKEFRGLSFEDLTGNTLDAAVAVGVMAPFETPSKRWFDPFKSVSSAIPSPFYAKEGQGLFTGSSINPNLSMTPGDGLHQVYASPEDLRAYVNGTQYSPRVAGADNSAVLKFMKQTAEGLTGSGFISTDEQLLGNVAGLENAFAANSTADDKFNYTGISIDREALYNRGVAGRGSALHAFHDARTRMFENPELRGQAAFQAALRTGTNKPMYDNLVGTIRDLAAKDPSTAAGLYLKSAGAYGLRPSDIEGINVSTATEDMSLGQFVDDNFDALTDALANSGSGHVNTDDADLAKAVEGLRETNPAQVLAGELISAGHMKSIRLEDVSTYNQGRDVVRSAITAAEKRQRIALRAGDTQIGKLMNQAGRIPTREEAIAAIRNGLVTARRPVNSTPAVPEPEAPLMPGAPYKNNAYSGAAPVTGGSQPPQGPPHGPVATAMPEEEPVSGVGNTETPTNLDAPVNLADAWHSDRVPSALRVDAEAAGKWFADNYPDYVPGHGRAPQWLRDLKKANPVAKAHADTLMYEERAHGDQSVAAQMRATAPKKNNVSASRPASSQLVEASTTAQAVTSSNGSGAGAKTSTPTPGLPGGIDSFGGRDTFEDYEEVSPFTPGQRTPAMTAEQRDRIDADSARRAQMTDAEWTRYMRRTIGPADGSRLSNRPEDFPYQEATDELNQRIGRATDYGRIPESVQQKLSRVHLARSLMSELRPGVSLKGRVSAVYGDYDEVGQRFIGSDGDETISRETISQAQGMYEGAVRTAFGSGGFEGLSHKEIAATVHKRMGEALKQSLELFEKDMKDTGVDAGTAKSVRQRLSAVTNMMTQEGDEALSAALGAGGFKDVAYNAQRVSKKQLAAFAETNPLLKQRIEELGGLDEVASGDRKIIQAGENAYEVVGHGSRQGGNWEDRIKSIYSSNFGHLMMAQFMGQMAWKSTGGAVMDMGDQWSKAQTRYLGLDTFGGGEAGPGAMSSTWRDMASNAYGRLAYEQYGAFKDIGYALSQSIYGEGIGRFGNDLKMGLGVGAVAGIGTWGAGALLGSTALTAAAAPVGIGAALAVGVPSIAMSGYNMFTGQDSYEGASWRNTLATPLMRLGALSQGEFGWMGLTGKSHEEYAQERFGMSARDWFLSTTGGERLGPAFANWLFEGQTEEAKVNRDLANSIMMETGLGEDDVVKQLSGLQKALGGLDNSRNQQIAKQVIRQAQDQGTTADALAGQVAQLAEMQGFEVGTDYFGMKLANFSSMSFTEQQKYMRQAGRDYQRYAQWSPYLEGGNREAYELYSGIGGTNAAQTQAVQSIFSQAQMSGETLTPELARSLATSSVGLAPHRAMDISQMSSAISQIGAGGFSKNFAAFASAVDAGWFGFTLSDAGNLASGTLGLGNGNTADTMAFLKGLTSGNAYALSDYGRMADIGMFQTVDANGLQSGLKDMSGFLAYAQQNVLRNPKLTGAQTLTGLGLNFNYTSRDAMLNGGIWGYQSAYEDRVNGLQAHGLNLQFTQLANQRNFLWGGGDPNSPTAGSSWGLETQMTNVQWGAQLRNFDFQKQSMILRHGYELEDQEDQGERMRLSQDFNRWQRGFDYRTSLMRRDWARDDYQYNTQMRGLQYGWSMEDMDEQIRRSSGYERAMLIKQRDRATLSHNLGEQQAETQEDRQEQLWAREDERYERTVAYQEQLAQMDEERFERTKTRNEELYALQMKHLEDEVSTAKELHNLRLEMETLQRAQQVEQLKHTEASLNIQREMQNLQNEYAKNMTKISHTQQEWEASVRKITQYSPAFSRMLEDFLRFLQNASNISVPTSGSAITYR